MMSRPNVIVAYRDNLVRDILRLACAGEDIDVAAEVDSTDALRRLATALRPAVVVTADRLGSELVDGVLPDVLGTGARVIVLAADPSPERLAVLLGMGVSGYLFQDAAPDEVVSGIFAVARGAAVLNPTAAAMVLNQWRRLRLESGTGSRRLIPLTPRETDVLAALVDGLPTKAIAQRLTMATKTVENHKIRIFDKLGVRTQAEAVSLAIGHSLLATAVE